MLNAPLSLAMESEVNVNIITQANFNLDGRKIALLRYGTRHQIL